MGQECLAQTPRSSPDISRVKHDLAISLAGVNRVDEGMAMAMEIEKKSMKTEALGKIGRPSFLKQKGPMSIETGTEIENTSLVPGVMVQVNRQAEPEELLAGVANNAPTANACLDWSRTYCGIM